MASNCAWQWTTQTS